MKNSSPYTKDKLVHMACAKGLGNLCDHHSATVDREDLYFFFFLFFYNLFQGLTLKLALSVWGLHESCSLLKIYLPTQ